MTRRTAREHVVDGSLISRCKNRDAEAFGMLVDRYQARVFGFVRRMVTSSEDAEDIAQEVFIRAYQNIAKFDGRASLTTWLFKIANNLCIDRARKRARRPEQTPLYVTDGDGETEVETSDARWNPEILATAGQMEDVIERAIACMSAKLRTVLLLHDLEELSYDEIAATLAIPVGTVKSRLFLARAAMQDALQGYINGRND